MAKDALDEALKPEDEAAAAQPSANLLDAAAAAAGEDDSRDDDSKCARHLPSCAGAKGGARQSCGVPRSLLGPHPPAPRTGSPHAPHCSVCVCVCISRRPRRVWRKLSILTF